MKEKFDIFRRGLFRPPFVKRLLLMLIGVIFMGINVALLNMTRFGVDPYAGLCYGASELTGISFGTMELVVNSILLLIVIYFKVDGIGFGTLGNMVIVGYTADFVTFVLSKLGISYISSLVIRIPLMLFALFFFVLAVALYVNAGLGASPYDEIPYIIHSGINKRLGKDIKFRTVRILFDAVFTIVAFIIKGHVGVITVLMVLSLGPTIDLVAGFLSKILKLERE